MQASGGVEEQALGALSAWRKQVASGGAAEVQGAGGESSSSDLEAKVQDTTQEFGSDLPLPPSYSSAPPLFHTHSIAPPPARSGDDFVGHLLERMREAQAAVELAVRAQAEQRRCLQARVQQVLD